MFINIGDLPALEVVKLAADINRSVAWLGTANGHWRDTPKPLWELIPLSSVNKGNLWRFEAAPVVLRHFLFLSWEAEVNNADQAWAAIIRPKLQRLREIFQKNGPEWSRFSLIE